MDIKQQSKAVQEQIGRLVKMNREVKNWSQVELAETMGVGQHVVSRIESGEYNMTIETLCRIANAFGHTLDIKF